MKFFGLEINDILVSFILTLIVSGAITYFCHMRLKNIENAVTKQNQVLSSFITNVKNEINPTFSVSGSIDSPSTDIDPALIGSASLGSASLGSASLGAASLASSEAIKAVAALEDKNGLIEISDDDSDSSDSSQSDGSESDGSESEEDEEDQKIIPKLLDMNLGNLYEISQDDIKIIDLICIPPQKYNTTDIINSHNSKIIEIFDVNTSDTDSDDESEDEIIVKKIVVPTMVEVTPISVEATPVEVKPVEATPVEARPVEVQPIEATPIEVTSIEEKLIEAKPAEIVEILTEDLDTSFIKKIHTTHEEGETKLEKLKIEDLRHLAVTKGLGSKDEVKKIKKSELIALLEKL
jgi:hypothetical protein